MKIISWIIASLLLIGSCKVKYSFTGIQVGSAETINIETFPNRAPLANPTLSQTFSESLRDIFLSQTNLTLVQKEGDMKLEGEVTGYKTAPVAIQGNETAALTRLTITISVRFTNNTEEEKNFESSFSRFADFESSQSFSAVEDQLVTEINEQLAQDILNKAAGNW